MRSEESKPPSVSAAFIFAPYFGLHPRGWSIPSATIRLHPYGIITLVWYGTVSIPVPRLSPYALSAFVPLWWGDFPQPSTNEGRQPPFLSP